MELQELRSQIDNIDSQILDLMLKRRGVISEVVRYKKKHDMPVFSPERETQVLKRIEKTFNNEATMVNGVKMIYGILMDLYKFYEYQYSPKDISVPTRAGGASVRAVLRDEPGALSRYLSPLAAAQVNISNIRTQAMPGGTLLVDLELIGELDNPLFKASLAVLADTAEKFTLL